MVDPGFITGEMPWHRYRCSHGHEWRAPAIRTHEGTFSFADANGQPSELLCLRCLKDLLAGKVGRVQRIE